MMFLRDVCKPANRSRQSGAVLVTSLLFLLVMSLLAVTAMNVALLEEKMAGNLRDRSLAFQAAETALRSVEPQLTAANGATDMLKHFQCRPGLYDRLYCPPPPVLTDDFWLTGGGVTVAMSNLAHINAPPQYIIERLDCYPAPLERCERFPFRITVRASGGTTAAVVILQAVYLLAAGEQPESPAKFLGRQSWGQLR